MWLGETLIISNKTKCCRKVIKRNIKIIDCSSQWRNHAVYFYGLPEERMTRAGIKSLIGSTTFNKVK